MATMAGSFAPTPPFAARPLEADESVADDPARVWRLSRGQAVAVGVSVILGLVVGGYGLAGSYVTVSELAGQRSVPLASLVPAGIDGGLVAVVVLDLVVAWIGTPVGWLRQLVRVLSVGTVAANTVGGWPDPVAVGLHAAAPLMLLAMVEAGRTVLLRRMGQAKGVLRDSIPLARWVLAPWRTWLLWRRMVLWQITSYRRAVDTELELRRAVAVLRTRYGRRWRHEAPSDLVWMLHTGIHAEDACRRVLVAVRPGEPAAPCPGGRPDGATAHAAVWPESTASSPTAFDAEPALGGEADRERFAEAVWLNRQHWLEAGRPISAETLRKRLRLGAAKSRAWCRAIRVEDRVAVCGAK